MPAYPWLSRREVNPEQVMARMKALQRLGDPYSDEEIAAAPDAVTGKTEMEAMIAYLQGLGRTRTGR
jgi:cytochrome c oxidase cbb3-type subunit 2